MSFCQSFIRTSDASEEIARLYRNSIITDGVVYAKMTNTEILKLVRAHLYAHVVRMPFGEAEQTFYTQVIFILLSRNIPVSILGSLF